MQNEMDIEARRRLPETDRPFSNQAALSVGGKGVLINRTVILALYEEHDGVRLDIYCPRGVDIVFPSAIERPRQENSLRGDPEYIIRKEFRYEQNEGEFYIGEDLKFKFFQEGRDSGRVKIESTSAIKKEVVRGRGFIAYLKRIRQTDRMRKVRT